MPISKINTGAIHDDAVTGDKISHDVHIDGTEAIRIPQGTTAQRANALSGDQRFNSTTSLMEYYDGVQWRSIETVPVVTSISPSSIPDTDSSFSITITGVNFTSGATVKAIGQDGSVVNASSTSVDSVTQITATFNGTSFVDAQEDYDVRVVSSNGISGQLDNCLSVNASPSWTTTSGNIGEVLEGGTISGTTIQVAATDSESESITYALQSGDSLPVGLSLDSSTGAITGTESGSESYSPSLAIQFDLEASDGTNTATRSFNIIKKWYDGATQSQAITGVAADIITLTGTATDGYYWINIDGTAKEIYCDMGNGGWMYLMPPSDANDTNPFGYTLTTNSGGGVSCYAVAGIRTGLDWTYSKTYTCGGGTAYVGQTLSWTKPASFSYTQLGYAAVTNGNSQSHTVNGSGVGADRTNSKVSFYDTSTYTVGTNTGYENNTYQSTVISENAHRVINSTGNISIFAQAYSDAGAFGGATYIAQLRIK